MLRFSLLMVAVFLASGSCRAQQASPQYRIVDVMPVAEPDTTPQHPLVSLNFLIGAWPRPTWWGRTWLYYNPEGPEFHDARPVKARLVATSAEGTQQLGYSFCSSYAPRWNEALGLYTVRVRLAFGEAVRLWPKKTKMNLRGELPIPFDPSPKAPTLSFEVNLDELPEKGFPDAQLISPRPSIWVKWVRIFQRTGFPGEDKFFTYEANYMLTGRRDKIKHRTASLGNFFDDKGNQIVPIGVPQYGDFTDYSLDSNTRDFQFVENPLEFKLWRMVWNEGYGSVAPAEFLTQSLQYGEREPLQITFPIRRDGVSLEGDIPASEWKLESLAPSAN